VRQLRTAAALGILVAVSRLTGCFESPDPPEEFLGQEQSHDSDGAVSDAADLGDAIGEDIEASQGDTSSLDTDAPAATTAPLCEGSERCDVHCFVEVSWDQNSYTALMCKEHLAVSPEEAESFLLAHCGDALASASDPAGALGGGCPMTADLSNSGWMPMSQVAGCRLVDEESESTFTKWLYDRESAISDFKVMQGAPSQRDVEETCVSLSTNEQQFDTVVHCAPNCEAGATCDAVLCTDGDHDPCSTVSCVPGGDSVCGWDVDHALCDDEMLCTSDVCEPNMGCVLTPQEGICEVIACHAATCFGQPQSGESVDELGCLYAAEPDGAVCDDGEPCTEGDGCVDGVCEAGPQLDCSGQDSGCTIGICFPGTGICVGEVATANSNGSCSDGIGCYDAYLCNGSACVGSGTEADCDDGDGCTMDACSGDSCVHSNAAEGSPCDDLNPCTQTDRCQVDGSCAGTESCDDGDPCTMDTCDSGAACIHTINPLCSCCSEQSDHALCAEGETKAAVCAANPSCCEGAWGSECVTLASEEGACGVCGDDICDPGEPESCAEDCLFACDVDLDCDDWVACTRDTCEGVCAHDTEPVEGEPCNDWDPCSVTSACQTGLCEGVPVSSPTCSGSCPPILSVPVSLSPRTGAILTRLLHDGSFISPDTLAALSPEELPSRGVIFSAQDTGLRRFVFQTAGSGPKFFEAGMPKPWKSPNTPYDLAFGTTALFVASSSGVEMVHVANYQNPLTLSHYVMTSEARALALDEATQRLYVMGAEALEVLDVSTNSIKPLFTLLEVTNLSGAQMTQLIDVALYDETLLLLDASAGLVAFPTAGNLEGAPSQQLTPEQLFGDPEIIATRMVLSTDALYVLGEKQGDGSSAHLGRVNAALEVDWHIALGDASIEALTAGPCGGVSFAMGTQGLTWLPTGEAAPDASDLKVLYAPGFPVAHLSAVSRCAPDANGATWMTLGGHEGASAVRILTSAAEDHTSTLTGMIGRTGSASRVALYDAPDQDVTLAYVADGSGVRVGNDDQDNYKRNLQVFDVSSAEAPFAVDRCTLGQGNGTVRTVVDDGYGHLIALVAEETLSVATVLSPGWGGGSSNPCFVCDTCNIPLAPEAYDLDLGVDLEQWLNPRGAVTLSELFNIQGDTRRWISLIVAGVGPSILQVGDLSMHSISPSITEAYAKEDFPEGVQGLNAIAKSLVGEPYLYLGTLGTAAPLMIARWDDIRLDVGVPIQMTAVVSPSEDIGSARPVAMVSTAAGLLHVLLDDPAEIAGSSACEAADGDCQAGWLWTLDVTDPAAPIQRYLGGVSAQGMGDLGNPSDLRVAGDQLYIASRARGLIVVDTADPANPVIVSERALDGQPSGLALGAQAAFVASGTTALTVVKAGCDGEITE
jgi:hypothetical protein